MKIKILQVFYGEDGLPYKDQARTVHYPITGNGFQNANNTTQIRFYFSQLSGENTTWVAVSKLPNGKIGSKVLETFSDDELNEPYALLELDSYYTQYKGDVFISLQGYQGGVQVTYDEETELYEISGTPTIAATGSIRFTNNYAASFVGSGQEENVTLQQLLAIISSTVLRYNAEYSNTLAEVYTEVGTQICVLNIEGDEYLCEMSDVGSIVLYDIYSQEWYAFTGANTTTINDVLNNQYKHKILTEETANDTFLKLIGGTLTGRLIIEDNLNTSKLVIRGASSGQSYIQIYNNDNSHSSYLGTDNTGSLITYDGGYWRQLSTKKYVDDKILALGTVFDYKGSKTVAQINALTGQVAGQVYNVSDSGTLSAGNVSVLQGDNVVWNGSSWDKLTGDYVPLARTIAGIAMSSDITAQALTNALVLASNSDIDSLF